MGRVVQAIVHSPLLQRDALGNFCSLPRHIKAQPGYRGQRGERLRQPFVA